jgi:hypothetical protein
MKNHGVVDTVETWLVVLCTPDRITAVAIGTLVWIGSYVSMKGLCLRCMRVRRTDMSGAWWGSGCRHLRR